MIGNKIGRRLDPYIRYAIEKTLGGHGNPNLFTLMGLGATLLASFLIVKGFWFLAGLGIIVSGLFDLFDGVVARNLGKVTRFGGFLDSVVDRYSDLALLLAVLIYYLNNDNSAYVILASFASMGTALIPYARARAEAAHIQCSAGLMERAERMILLSAGLLLHCLKPVLWTFAILTHFTVLERIYHVYRQLRKE